MCVCVFVCKVTNSTFRWISQTVVIKCRSSEKRMEEQLTGKCVEIAQVHERINYSLLVSSSRQTQKSWVTDRQKRVQIFLLLGVLNLIKC